MGKKCDTSDGVVWNTVVLAVKTRDDVHAVNEIILMCESETKPKFRRMHEWVHDQSVCREVLC